MSRYEPKLPVMTECWVHVVQQRDRAAKHFLHVIHVSLIDLNCFELFLEQLKGKKGEKDTLDESCDTHDKGNEVALLEKERNLTFILHKKIKLEES